MAHEGNCYELPANHPVSPKVGTSTSNPKCAQITGTGVLIERDGPGKWYFPGYAGSKGQVNFTATIYDSGKLKACNTKNLCSQTDVIDYFGMAVANGSTIISNTFAPVSTPTTLGVSTGAKIYTGGGSIHIK